MPVEVPAFLGCALVEKTRFHVENLIGYVEKTPHVEKYQSRVEKTYFCVEKTRFHVENLQSHVEKALKDRKLPQLNLKNLK